ncbi:MAG: hypothetical protein N4J56_003816 [Chroococcidiopsis sp. SAG 2025]|nr:hypothetical protein [Chroococcidiopsis sp. SAG 2025]MDV2994162.1 hypothetical protein [Chroococcidiopsis sp. SAG 2025]
MKNQEKTIVFDRERASNHDKQFAKLAPMRVRYVYSSLYAKRTP